MPRVVKKNIFRREYKNDPNLDFERIFQRLIREASFGFLTKSRARKILSGWRISRREANKILLAMQRAGLLKLSNHRIYLSAERGEEDGARKK